MLRKSNGIHLSQGAGALKCVTPLRREPCDSRRASTSWPIRGRQAEIPSLSGPPGPHPCLAASRLPPPPPLATRNRDSPSCRPKESLSARQFCLPVLDVVEKGEGFNPGNFGGRREPSHQIPSSPEGIKTRELFSVTLDTSDFPRIYVCITTIKRNITRLCTLPKTPVTVYISCFVLIFPIPCLHTELFSITPDNIYRSSHV